jgi:hypothetical protein
MGTEHSRIFTDTASGSLLCADHRKASVEKERKETERAALNTENQSLKDLLFGSALSVFFHLFLVILT